jgi:hypothetical protein
MFLDVGRETAQKGEKHYEVTQGKTATWRARKIDFKRQKAQQHQFLQFWFAVRPL